MLLKLHSISHFLWKKNIKLFPQMIKAFIYITHHCVIPPSRIGKGTKFWHHGLGVVMHPGTTIGRNCNIYNHVVFGGGHDGPFGPAVKIVVRDNVNIGAGAKLLCKSKILRIGTNSSIEANAVVTDDIGDNMVIGGIPAKVIKYKKTLNSSTTNSDKKHG